MLIRLLEISSFALSVLCMYDEQVREDPIRLTPPTFGHCPFGGDLNACPDGLGHLPFSEAYNPAEW